MRPQKIHSHGGEGYASRYRDLAPRVSSGWSVVAVYDPVFGVARWCKMATPKPWKLVEEEPPVGAGAHGSRQPLEV